MEQKTIMKQANRRLFLALILLLLVSVVRQHVTIYSEGRDHKPAYAFHSGRFLMDKDGKKFIGSVNRSLNPDDNDYPVTATLDKSFKRLGKD
jgi:hypothetical protein